MVDIYFILNGKGQVCLFVGGRGEEMSDSLISYRLNVTSIKTLHSIPYSVLPMSH